MTVPQARLALMRINGLLKGPSARHLSKRQRWKLVRMAAKYRATIKAGPQPRALTREEVKIRLLHTVDAEITKRWEKRLAFERWLFDDPTREPRDLDDVTPWNRSTEGDSDE